MRNSEYYRKVKIVRTNSGVVITGQRMGESFNTCHYIGGEEITITPTSSLNGARCVKLSWSND